MDNLIDEYEDQLPGGRGDGRDPSEFDEAALKKGIKVEMEHTTDPMLALEITIDHLSEREDYYDRLETIDPHEDEEKPNIAQPVKRKDKKPRKFIIGDEIIELMSTVASELLDRGQKDLAGEVNQFVASIQRR